MTHPDRIERLTAEFARRFGSLPDGIAEAPGRVNLIGEHVDYNDGLVLPFAIDRSVLCAWVRRSPGRDGLVLPKAGRLALLHRMATQNETLVWMHSNDYDGDMLEETSADHRPLIREPGDDTHGMIEPGAADWTNYVSAVIYALGAEGLNPRGLVGVIAGNIPQGAGLSSSAALELAVAGAFRDAFAMPIDDVALALLCQRAENEYVGVQCGIMDQFASALSRAGHALLINCRTLAYERIPFDLERAGLAIVVANSAVKRELAASAYNERRRECAEAVDLLRERLSRHELTSLRDVTLAELEGVGIDSTSLRRARHVVSEIARVASAVEALRTGDFPALGALMRASHVSLRDDYDVSSQELDLLVALADAQPYTLGARLTGAGFGGCTVNLVRADAIGAFERDVIAAYRERTGLPAEMYVVTPSDGLRTWRT